MRDPTVYVCVLVCESVTKERDRETGTQQRLQMGTTNKREERKSH